MAKDPKQQQQQQQYHRSIFETPPDFFDSCRLLQSPFTISQPLSNQFNHEQEESITTTTATNDIDESQISTNMQKWSCNTCKSDFDSLLDQRFHFKSDLHRFNIKLSVVGKNTITEEDFDEETCDSLCRDNDVSSISGSDDEDDREISRRQHEFGGDYKSKLFIQSQNGDRFAIWKCLLLVDSEYITFDNEKPLFLEKVGSTLYLTPREVIDKLKYVIREPRDNTRLRIMLLARGGHFAGCVFDGNTLVTHKTFHRYVVRAKAGKKQSTKDGGGRNIHSAGASLRRYNELALKKDIQELLDLWKPHFAAASCIFVSASSNNRQLLFDGEKPYFICQPRAVRNIPLTVRRPTLKEAKRIYSLLTQISPVASEETALSSKEESVNSETTQTCTNIEPSKKEITKKLKALQIAEASPKSLAEMDGLSEATEAEKEIEIVGISTPLHEAAKLGDVQKVLELLEQGLDPCVKDERGQTPYTVAIDKEVRNTFRRFMASNLEKWDWNAAKVPSALTKEMEESQAAKQAEKDAKRKAKAKELKKLKKAKEKKAQVEAAESQKASSKSGNSKSGAASKPSGSALLSKEEELQRARDAEREKRAAAAERRMAALKTQGEGSGSVAGLTNSTGGSAAGLCSCCSNSLAGLVPFHRYNYKYCSSTCMHLHREILEDG